MAVYIDAVMYEFAEHRDQLSSNGSKAFEASKPNTGGIDARRTRSARVNRFTRLMRGKRYRQWCHARRAADV
jgi:hypothetical protein